MPTHALRLSRISNRTGISPRWSMAVFAHNEALRIRAALNAIARASGDRAVAVYVLANGCTDRTADVVRECGDLLPHLSLVEIDLGDKAHAWNVYVHEVVPAEHSDVVAVHFFTDGDVTLEPHALPRLVAALDEVPTAQAAGGMPVTGRDRDAWRERMVENGNLAGNLYALRSGFVEEIQRQAIRLPVGLFGEDRFVSWLVASDLGRSGATDDAPRCVFHAGAGFSFRSLSPMRPRDYRTYLRRKWRYTRRELQHEMLMPLLMKNGLRAMPHDIRDLYRRGPWPSRLRWAGLDTPLRLLAVLSIRSFRRARQGASLRS